MESFSLFHLRQDVSDTFFQSSALTISLLLYRDGVGCDSSMAPKRGIFTREIIRLLLIWTPHFVSPYGKMLPCKLHVSKYEIHGSMVQHAGNTGAEPLPIVLSVFATSLVLTSESLGEVMWITSGRSFRNPREALLSFCPGDWQYSTLVAAASAWDSQWGWWQQHSPKPSFSNCHKNEKSTFRLLGLGGCLWLWRTLVYPDWHNPPNTEKTLQRTCPLCFFHVNTGWYICGAYCVFSFISLLLFHCSFSLFCCTPLSR